MPRLAKKTWMGKVPIAPRITNSEDLIIPAPVLRCFVRETLKRIPQLKRFRTAQQLMMAENFFMGALVACTDARWSKACREESSEVIAAGVKIMVEKLFHRLGQKHPAELVRVHAQIVMGYVRDNPNLKNTGRRADGNLLVTEHVPKIVALMNRVQCSDKCARGSTPITEEGRKYIASSKTEAQLRNRILTFYHYGTSTNYIQQLLAGR